VVLAVQGTAAGEEQRGEREAQRARGAPLEFVGQRGQPGSDLGVQDFLAASGMGSVVDGTTA
jgi:hypothetical protein